MCPHVHVSYLRECHLHPLLKPATEHLHKRIVFFFLKEKCSSCLRYKSFEWCRLFATVVVERRGLRPTSKTFSRMKEAPLVLRPLKGAPMAVRSCLNFERVIVPKVANFVLSVTYH